MANDGKALERLISRSLKGLPHMRIEDGGKGAKNPQLADFILWNAKGETTLIECKSTKEPLNISRVQQLDRIIEWQRDTTCKAVIIVDFHADGHNVFAITPLAFLNALNDNKRKSLTYSLAEEYGKQLEIYGGFSRGTVDLEPLWDM